MGKVNDEYGIASEVVLHRTPSEVTGMSRMMHNRTTPPHTFSIFCALLTLMAFSSWLRPSRNLSRSSDHVGNAAAELLLRRFNQELSF